MAIVTLDGIQYITEAIEDTTIPAHNYDDVIDVSKAEDPDEWFGRVQAEWPSLPSEIKQKVLDNTGDYIGKLSSQVAPPAQPQNPPTLEEGRVDGAGNEVYDFAQGREKMASMDDAALEHTRKDLVEVIKNQESMKKEGFSTPKLGYYWDEYWTLIDEVNRRQKK